MNVVILQENKKNKKKNIRKCQQRFKKKKKKTTPSTFNLFHCRVPTTHRKMIFQRAFLWNNPGLQAIFIDLLMRAKSIRHQKEILCTGFPPKRMISYLFPRK